MWGLICQVFSWLFGASEPVLGGRSGRWGPSGSTTAQELLNQERNTVTFFLEGVGGMQDLSSPTRDRTRARCSGSAES